MGIKNFNNILKEYVNTEIKEYNLRNTVLNQKR